MATKIAIMMYKTKIESPMKLVILSTTFYLAPFLNFRLRSRGQYYKKFIALSAYLKLQLKLKIILATLS